VEDQNTKMQNNPKVSTSSTDVALTFWQKINYSCGGFANNVLLGLYFSFMIFFFTDVLLIPVGLVSLFSLVCRFWDAVNDPVIGVMADRTQSPKGRYRPWILYSFPLLIVCTCLLFFTLPSGLSGFQAAFTLAMYFFYVLFYTMHDVPYSAMPAALTTNYASRGSIGAFRLAFGNLGMILAVATFLPLVNVLGGGDVNAGYFRAVIVLMIITVPFFLIAYYGTKEVVLLDPNAKRVPIREYFKIFKGNKPFIAMCLAYAFWGLWGNVGGTSRIYFFNYVYGDQAAFSFAATCQTVGMTVGAFLCNLLLKKAKNKRTPGMIAWFTGGAVLIGMAFIRLSPATLPLWYFCTFIYGICGMCGLTSIFACTPDLTVYTQRRYGIAAASFIFAVVNFAFKLAGTVGTSAFTWVLGLMDYVPGAEQTPAVESVMRASCTWLIGLFLIAGAIFQYMYKIDESSHKMDLSELA
jgi:sugar (glycoside-pentoside-hexuronide) transporter